MKGVRVSTGIEGLDRVLGHDWRDPEKTGIHVPSVILFAGAAGSGKSTLLLRLAARIKLKSRRPFQYVTSEQTLSEIRENAERLGLSNEEIRRIEAEECVELQDVLKAMKKVNPQVAVVDSLNELVDSKNDTNDTQANMIRYATAFKVEAETNNRAIILITHMNKQHEIAGVQRLQHIVSTVMILSSDARDKTKRKIGCPKKNRFGNTADEAWFSMTEHGLIDAAKPEPEEVEPRDRWRRQRFSDPG